MRIFIINLILLLISSVGFSQEPLFPIGTKWTYEYFPYSINPFIVTHSFVTFEVKDTFRSDNKLIYRIENNRPLVEGYLMYQVNDKIYFWEHAINDFQLTYNFNADQSYKTKYTVICGNPTPIFDVDVIVDSVTCCVNAGNWGLLNVQHVSIPFAELQNEDSLKKEIIEYVGIKEGGLKFGLGEGLCDNFEEGYVGKIRCFEKGGSDFSVNFTEDYGAKIPCDSVWTRIINTVDDPIKTLISIYPNPASENITLVLPEGNELEKCEIFNMMGNVVKVNNCEFEYIDVADLTPGLYYIEAKDRQGRIYIGKFIVL